MASTRIINPLKIFFLALLIWAPSLYGFSCLNWFHAHFRTIPEKKITNFIENVTETDELYVILSSLYPNFRRRLQDDKNYIKNLTKFLKGLSEEIDRIHPTEGDAGLRAVRLMFDDVFDDAINVPQFKISPQQKNRLISAYVEFFNDSGIEISEDEFRQKYYRQLNNLLSDLSQRARTPSTNSRAGELVPRDITFLLNRIDDIFEDEIKGGFQRKELSGLLVRTLVGGDLYIEFSETELDALAKLSIDQIGQLSDKFLEKIAKEINVDVTHVKLKSGKQLAGLINARYLEFFTTNGLKYYRKSIRFLNALELATYLGVHKDQQILHDFSQAFLKADGTFVSNVEATFDQELIDALAARLKVLVESWVWQIGDIFGTHKSLKEIIEEFHRVSPSTKGNVFEDLVRDLLNAENSRYTTEIAELFKTIWIAENLNGLPEPIITSRWMRSSQNIITPDLAFRKGGKTWIGYPFFRHHLRGRIGDAKFYEYGMHIDSEIKGQILRYLGWAAQNLTLDRKVSTDFVPVKVTYAFATEEAAQLFEGQLEPVLREFGNYIISRQKAMLRQFPESTVAITRETKKIIEELPQIFEIYYLAEPPLLPGLKPVKLKTNYSGLLDLIDKLN